MTTPRLLAALTSSWPWWMPAAGLAALLLHPEQADNVALAVTSAILVGCVLAAVHHSEVVAHRVGEPFGTLILAGSVTIIEASLILSMMLSGSANPALPRDTVFAAIMLILNGVVGGCLLVGGIRHGEQRFVLEGVNAALCVLAAMATLVLVLPSVTSGAAALRYSVPQLVFTAIVSTLLYATFVFVQTIRHRDYFLPEGEGALAGDAHASPPSARTAAGSLGLLLVALVSVVLLAKSLSKPLETAITAAALPRALVGIAIAALVLAPESLAALRAARRNRLQTSLNLALGSALATIGLTIPTVAVAALVMGWPLSLGLDPKGITLLALSLGAAILSFGTGRTTILQGAVHLVLLAAYIFTTIYS
ncbi:calcium:proton antiporter [Sphingopyxis fribergensis]